MDNNQTIVQKHRKFTEDRKTINFEKNTVTLKDLKEQIIKSESSIVDAIESDEQETSSNNESKELPQLKKLLNTFSSTQGEQQTKLINIISDFFDNVVDSGFSKDLSKFIPNIEKFGAWYKEAETDSNSRLDKINTTFEEVIKNASDEQIAVLKMYHQASINQEKKRFDLEVKEMQQRKLEQSLANAEGNVTLDLMKKIIPGFGSISSALNGISNSAKVWNRFKDEGFWKKLGGYLAYNDKGILGSIGDLLLLKLGGGLKGLFSMALLTPLKNIFGGLMSGGLKGMGGGLMANFKKGKGLAKLGGVLQAGMGIYNAFDIEDKVKNGEMTREEANKAQASNAGGTVGGIVGGALGTFLGPIGTIVGSWLGEKIGSWLGEYIYDNWDNIVKWFGDAWNAITNGFKQIGIAISNWWNGLIKSISDTWNSIIQFGKDICKSVITGITNFITGIGTFFTNLGTDIWNGFTGAFEAAKQNVNNMITGVINIISNIWTDISNFFTGIWNNITGGISAAWTSVTNFVKDPAGSMGIDTQIFGKIFNGISDGIKKWWDDKVSILKNGWKSIKSFFGYSDDETKEKMDEIEKQTEDLKTGITIDKEKGKGKDITPRVLLQQGQSGGAGSVIQQNNVNNINNSQTNVHSTPVLSTQQADPNMNMLGSGWSVANYGVIPVY